MRALAWFALLLPLAGCGGGHHLYAGSQRPVSQLAKLECYRGGTDVRLVSVDGEPAPENYVYLLPGRHRIALDGPTHIASRQEEVDELSPNRDDVRPRVEIELELLAGQHYFLGAGYKELAFLRSRSDQTRFWEEGFYSSWTLDLYARPHDGLGLPPLIRQFTYEAE